MLRQGLHKNMMMILEQIKDYNFDGLDDIIHLEAEDLFGDQK